MLSREFYYRDFLKEVNQRLEEYIVQLHYIYEKRNDWIIKIDQHKDKYKEVGIDINPIYNIDNTIKIFYNKKQRDKLNKLLISYINSYNYCIYSKIPLLNDKIEALAAVRNVLKQLYSVIQYELNFEISKLLLKGNNYSFGGKIGYIYIYIQNLDRNPNVRIVDKKETIKLYNLLKENGIPIKTKDNPDGKPFKIYLPYRDIPRCKFRIGKTRIDNALFYKFHLDYIYTYDNPPRSIAKNYKSKRPTELTNRTFNELVEDRDLAIYNKLLAISLHLGDLKYNIYHNNKNYINQQSINNYHE